WPGSNPRDEEFFELAKASQFHQTRLTAFGSTRRAKVSCDEDDSIQCLIRAETPVVTVFGKSWKFHATHALGITPEQNLELIGDTVRYLKARVDEVIFDAEHFFDGYADDPKYALSALKIAEEAGADFVVLCDTNGGTVVPRLQETVRLVKSSLSCAVGIHTHNDSELAVANALAAVSEGATMVQGTINGYGERCGNANLVSIIAGLEIKMGRQCLPDGGLRRLTHVSRQVDELSNNIPWRGQPYVGRSAFAHKGGVHVSAVMKDARTYEHIEPERIGNERRVLVSDLSGRSNIVSKMADFGVELDPKDPRTRSIVERVKDLEARGQQYEGAEASFKLLVDEALGRRPSYFELKDMRCVVSLDDSVRVEPGQSASRSEAVVEAIVGGVTERATASGNGPVHALDGAFRQVMSRAYPVLRDVRLLDYKVRILASSSGTDSTVRVLIQSGDGEEIWGTAGVSTNIIEASWIALVEALEYKLVKDGVKPLVERGSQVMEQHNQG
ncbi:MAG: citramalate synthase, partial [Myxococcales bacterium]|nr:citramalate synthase [Myxococcales bacterium]